MRKNAAIVALSLLAVVGLGVATWFGAARRLAPPDVILITVDTLRVDHVGAFFPDSPAATPNIDALAADGVRYTQAWSPISVTGPAFTSLMTGQEPGTHGVVMNLFRGGDVLAQDTQTLAEQLKARFYATGAFVSGFTLRRQLGLGQGFDVYDDPSVEQRRRPGQRTARRALRWLDSLYPWQWVLLWVHDYDPHGPLTPYEDAAPLGPDWERDPERLAHLPEYQRIDGVTDPDLYTRRYAAAVQQADDNVGAVVAGLRAAGRYDHALIVLTADHGETLTERPLWMDHGTHASAEQLHVPLIIKYPRGRDAGAVVDHLVSLVDVTPTILADLGLDPLPAADGHPIGSRPRPQVLGESSHCKSDPILDCSPKGVAGKEVSLRTEQTALVRRNTTTGVDWQLYDRTTDPREVGPPQPPADPTEQALLTAMAQDRAARPAAAPQVDPAPSGVADPEAEALRALGYIE